MNVSMLRAEYNKPYNAVYYDIKNILQQNGFEWIQGSTYLTRSEDMGNVVKAVMALSKIDWFKKSVRDIRGYKVENWSDFTDIIRNS